MTAKYVRRVYGTAWAIVLDEGTAEPREATSQELKALEEVYAPHLEKSLVEVI